MFSTISSSTPFPLSFFFFFFFNDTATTEIYTLSLHDALPIFISLFFVRPSCVNKIDRFFNDNAMKIQPSVKNLRSEEHTSELQSRPHLVCRLLLEKKKTKKINISTNQQQIQHI